MKIFLFPLILFLILINVNCSTSETEKMKMNLLHDIWALESVQGKKIIIDESIKNMPVLEIYVDEERVYGNTSCNTIDGKVVINKNNIAFSDIITTEMACPGDLEKIFLSALRRVNNYKIEKMKLYLYEDENEIMIFQKID